MSAEVIIPLITLGELHAERLLTEIGRLRSCDDRRFEPLTEVRLNQQCVWDAHIANLTNIYTALRLGGAENIARERARGLQAAGRIAIGAVMTAPDRVFVDATPIKVHLFAALRSTLTYAQNTPVEPKVPIVT